MTDSKPVRYYLISVFLLLIFFGVRLFRIDALPLFIDEMLIVQRSEATLRGNPLGFAIQGKLLLPWIGALFNPSVNGWWIPRVVTLLLIFPAAAAIIAMAKHLQSWRVGWVTLILISITPILHFHDRLALTDTVLTGMLTIFTLILLWAFDAESPKWKMAMLSGVIFVVALLAKSSAILLTPLPLVAAIVLPKTWNIMNRLKGLAFVYGTILALWIPFQLILMWRNINFWGRAAQGSTSGALLDLERIVSNIGFVWEGYTGYGLHPVILAFIGIGIVVALFQHTRYTLFLLAMILGFAFALILIGDQPLYYRYWLPPIPIAFVLAISGLDGVRQGNDATGEPISLVLGLVVLSILNLTPLFLYVNYTNPANLNIPHLDRQQYIEADSAGTAIPETAAFLHDATIPIVGAFPQCRTLSLYLRRDITCLNIAGDAAVRLPRINDELAQQTTPFYLVLENRGYATSADITAVTLHPLATFERPSGLIAIVVYEAK